MKQILPYAVVILALWFFPDAYAHKNKHWSSLEEYDFYYENKSSNKSTLQDNLSTSTTANSSKTDDHKNVDKQYTGTSIPKNISTWSLKRLMRYFISLLHSITANSELENELLDEYENKKVPYSKNDLLKTSDAPVVHKGSETEKIDDSEFESSGGGNDSEYYDEDISSKNSHKNGSKIKISKSNNGENSGFRNHRKIYENEQNKPGDKPKFTPKLLHSNRENPNPRFLKFVRVSGEFIDKYINPPERKELMESSGKSTAIQPIISKENGNQTYATLEKGTKEGKVSKIQTEEEMKEDRTLTISQIPTSGNTTTKINITVNKGLKDEYPRKESKTADSTTQISSLNQTRGLKTENLKEFSTDGNITQNSYSSNSSTLFTDNPQNNENHTLKMKPFSAEHTSKILNENSKFSKELSHPKYSEISSVIQDTLDKGSKEFSVLDDLHKQHLQENESLNSDPGVAIQSKEESDETEEMYLQYTPNSTKNLPLQDAFNNPDSLSPQNSSNDTESENDSDIPIELYSVPQVKYLKLEEDQDKISNSSERLKIQTGSDTDDDSSENGDSEESYEDDDYYEDIQLIPNVANNFTETSNSAHANTLNFTQPNSLTTQPIQNTSAPRTNFSKETESPVSSDNESKVNTLHNTTETFNSLLEFLYKYSNSTWIKDMREENRKI